MVLLEDIVEVFDLPGLDGAATAVKFQERVYSPQAVQVGANRRDDDSVGHAV